MSPRRRSRCCLLIHARYAFLYNQYKHGLTVALRPFGGNPIPPGIIAGRKASLTGVLASYETRKPTDADLRREQVISFMLHPETQPFLTELHASDNLLRFSGDNRETHIDSLIEDAQRLTKLVNVIVLNRVDLIAPQADAAIGNTFRLPRNDLKDSRGVRVSVQRDCDRWTIDAFSEEL
jgi:hypothetical protein